ncbi:hypothetical protein CBP12_01825 [Oceanisphaera avium]|uniref:DUF1496 domain-containing protein n=2 Tax=Oceanisphaera avium TaxID=1903694 RepID=A0A1Y0D0F4_9GAMM|nr:hypothetical protein CBP12_01825 [Oceanisphaera avium]
MKWITLCIFALSAQAWAVPHTVISRPGVELNLNSDLEPACFYADQRYSKGAIIEMARQPYICAQEKSFEQNGRLSWQPMSEQDPPLPKVSAP